MKGKSIILLIITLILVTTFGIVAIAAKPSSVPPIISSGPTTAMETGYDILDLAYFGTAHDHFVIYRGEKEFSFDEVRHVSLTIKCPEYVTATIWIGFPTDYDDAFYTYEMIIDETKIENFEFDTMKFKIMFETMDSYVDIPSEIPPFSEKFGYINYSFAFPGYVE